jgi:hypothetical protein
MEEEEDEDAEDDEESGEKSYVPGSQSDRSYDHEIDSMAESEFIAIEAQSNPNANNDLENVYSEEEEDIPIV